MFIEMWLSTFTYMTPPYCEGHRHKRLGSCAVTKGMRGGLPVQRHADRRVLMDYDCPHRSRPPQVSRWCYSRQQIVEKQPGTYCSVAKTLERGLCTESDAAQQRMLPCHHAARQSELRHLLCRRNTTSKRSARSASLAFMPRYSSSSLRCEVWYKASAAQQTSSMPIFQILLLI